MASILRINNNVSAVNALRHLNQTSFHLNKTLQRLASGLRIVTASDDPAGLIISEQLRAQVASLKAVSRNVSEANQYFGIAEAALDEVSRLLVEMRQLAVHASNGATSDDQRAADEQAFVNAADSINTIVTTSRYAGSAIFDGIARSYVIGENPDSGTGQDIISFTMPDVSSDADLAALQGATWATAADAEASIADVDSLQATISDLRGDIGSYQKFTFQARERALAIQIENVTAAESNIRDANMAEETTNFTKYQILTQAGIAVLAQANVVSQNVLQLLG